MSVLLALLSSGLWGVSDFYGGVVTRRIPVLSVVALSQAFALVGLVVVTTLVGGFTSPGAYLGWGVGCGLVGSVALGSFYRALATGTMGVVAPVAATGVVVPVVVGLVSGDRPHAAQLVGVAAAVVGVVLASGPELRDAERSGAKPLLLSLVAAVGFGLVIVFIAHGSRTSVAMTLIAHRVTGLALLATVIGVRRKPWGAARSDLLPLALVGGGDVLANGMFALASRIGLLSVVSVLASLYPVVTTLLARQLHHERLQPLQVAGVSASMLGVLLIAGG